MGNLRLGFNLGGVVQREPGGGEHQHGHQADAGADPVPLMQVLEPEGTAFLVRNGRQGWAAAGFMRRQRNREGGTGEAPRISHQIIIILNYIWTHPYLASRPAYFYFAIHADTNPAKKPAPPRYAAPVPARPAAWDRGPIPENFATAPLDRAGRAAGRPVPQACGGMARARGQHGAGSWIVSLRGHALAPFRLPAINHSRAPGAPGKACSSCRITPPCHHSEGLAAI
jgi:hypothetical protein